jgi:hypothetical protein
MSDAFTAEQIAAYSVILTWVVDFLSKLPKVGTYIQGAVKQLVAVGVGVGYCLATGLSVFNATAGIGGSVLTGILLAAIAGLGWSKVANILSAKREEINARTDNTYAKTDEMVINTANGANR